MAEIEIKGQVAAEPPHSLDQASLDEKGRLKLPAPYVTYLQAIGETSVFITTVDFRQVRLYPLSTWKANESLFESAGENAAVAERVALVAKAYGGDSDIDPQGRVLLPASLRTEMGLEKQAMMVDYHNGRINAVTKKVHDETLQAARANLTSDVATLVKMGFK